MNAVEFNIPKGNEPMKFTEGFLKAIGQRTIYADLSQVEQKVAEDLCRRQDQQVTELLASP